MPNSHKTRLSSVLLTLISASYLALIAPQTAHAAEDSVPYKVSMKRTDPNNPLRKSTIMAKVKELYPGRILSIVENNTGGPDCHIVKMMGDDGEFRIVHVACQ